MTWSPRQHAMLSEMGIPLWFAPEPLALAVETSAKPEPVSTQTTRQQQPVATPVSVVPHATAVPTPALGPRPEGIASMDWPALRSAVAACTACGLCRSRTQAVFGVGHPRAHWMVIGEAPGEQEDQQGEPFVGKSGQLLDNMLRALGLGRGPSDDPARQVFAGPRATATLSPRNWPSASPICCAKLSSCNPKLFWPWGALPCKACCTQRSPLEGCEDGCISFKASP
jgi:uracil-DNA glycosylase